MNVVLQCKGSWKNKTKQVNISFQIVVTTDRNVTLVDLEPYTVYTMSVKCIPLVMVDGVLERRGYWSEGHSFQFRTPSDG